ncbi:stage V sporulation protein AD [Alteribacillus persepolensis]|uniref:Stage V sporulation protein AD n=1 Tax=Alteribacillus persepolensis TaxID=568899 RepID=A0A1G7ZM54_9BACI|nr:stage V sporulation protein AD [Alteribacillus persepolensis]SDH09758.1 stage V sporulation protein AD [Alteribacillus persepolensis]
MLQGSQSWTFANSPVILSTGVVGGPFEAKGNLSRDFDHLFSDLWMSEASFEKAQTKLMEEAANASLAKINKKPEDMQFVLAGDLINQITATSFACRTLSIPYIGLFGACSTSMEGLALASFIVDNNGGNYVLTGTASHNAAVEKQFRYPTEYGAQKPPTAQWTATASGAAVVGKTGNGPMVTSATIGKVVDMGLKDPFNMGGAMAPAAADTIEAHFTDFNRDPSYYDYIVTGDLGSVGHPLMKELLQQRGVQVTDEQCIDCGLLIYNEDQKVQAGASGSGCSAAVVYGHLLNRMKKKEINKMLVVATGALLSPLSYQQKESIPCIAHAVSIERGDWE